MSKELELPEHALLEKKASDRDWVASPDKEKSQESKESYSYDEIVGATIKFIPVKTSINKLGIVIVAAIIWGLIIITAASIK